MIKEITLDNWPELWAKLTERFPQEDLRSRALSMPKAKKVEDLTFPNQPNFKNGWDKILKNNSDWNVQGVAQIAWYVDARAIRNRLNAVIGPHNWRSDIALKTDGAECRLSIKINGEWITKTDVSEYTQIEATKGGASKALIRAAVNWGIGEYLYDVQQVWPIKLAGNRWVFDNQFSGKWMDFRIDKDWLPAKS